MALSSVSCKTIVEGARAMILDSHLPLILWAEALTTMTYIKNRSPTPFTVHESTVTPFQAWNHGVQPTLDHLRIFGSTTYVLNETKPLPRLTTKAWTGYLVGYEGRHQYRIYDPARQAVFVRRDVIFDETSIGPKSDSPAVDAMAASESEVTLGFPSLCFPYIPWVDDSPAIPLTEDVIMPNPTSPPSAAKLPQPNSDTNENNETIPSDSEDELSPPPPSSRQSPAPPPPPSSEENPAPQSQRRSARLETKPTPDYCSSIPS